MPTLTRTLAPAPVPDLASYLDDGGGRALAAVRAAEPEAVIEEIEAARLRSRGGTGVPAGAKWRQVRDHGVGAAVAPTTVVNAAEGEPGSFKDRAILMRNPYLVLEGALVAAVAVGAGDVLVAMKERYSDLRERVEAAIAEATEAGWCDGVTVSVFAGPDSYLYGEETAMLEAIDGRPPFPRIAPPYRRGVHDVLDRSVGPELATASAAHIELAGAGAGAVGSPALVNNVETLANVRGIILQGSDWFRSVGTAESAGTIVCTVTGATQRAGVGEVPMGTPLREVLDLIGGGPEPGHEILAVLGGAATPLLTAEQLDTPVSFEGMAAIGGMLGAGAFIAFDERADIAAVAEGVARFLAVESCGLCVPCKEDGLALADLFGRVRRSEADERDLAAIRDRLGTVTNGARCNLAVQFELVLSSVLDRFGDALAAHVGGHAAPAGPELIASIASLEGTVAHLDEAHRDKQPDWSFGPRWSGKSPADLASSL